MRRGRRSILIWFGFTNNIEMKAFSEEDLPDRESIPRPDLADHHLDSF